MKDQREKAYRAFLKRQFVNRPKWRTERQKIAATFTRLYERRGDMEAGGRPGNNWYRHQIEYVQLVARKWLNGFSV